MHQSVCSRYKSSHYFFIVTSYWNFSRSLNPPLKISPQLTVSSVSSRVEAGTTDSSERRYLEKNDSRYERKETVSVPGKSSLLDHCWSVFKTTGSLSRHKEPNGLLPCHFPLILPSKDWQRAFKLAYSKYFEALWSFFNGVLSILCYFFSVHWILEENIKLKYFLQLFLSGFGSMK